MTRFGLDRAARRLDHGRVLLGGSPLRLFRLTAGGAAIVDAIERGEDITDDGSARRLTDRLLDAGAIHPRPDGTPWTAADVTAVIPAFAADPADVARLVASLGEVGEVIVVDDASEPPLDQVSGARLVRRAVNGGPGAARNTGLAEVTTPLVAFVDDDTSVQPGWLEPLLAHLADPQAGLAAPRVTGPPAGPGDGVLARYEAARSPLDLGPSEARIRARTRVGYVPAAALVVRTSAARELGGFDESLRAGEDVDLCWRLDEDGWRCRYEPAAVAQHAPRRQLRRWLAQRATYGRSAAPLSTRHPGALAPAALSVWSVGAWGLTVTGHPIAGVAVTLGAATALARKLRSKVEHPLPLALRLAGLGTLAAGRQLAEATTRVWWPFALTAALLSRRARLVVAAVALARPLAAWVRLRPSLDPARFTVLHVLDDAAYGLGVWQGALAARTTAPLRPDLTSWPAPSRYDRSRGAGPFGRHRLAPPTAT